MHIIGLVVVAFGCVVLIPGIYALFLAFTRAEDFGSFACLVVGGVLPVASIAAGVALMRRAENRLRKPRTRVLEPTDVPPSNPFSRLRHDLGTFDLNRLNWIGWLLGLVTVGMMTLAGAAIFMATGQEVDADHQPPRIWGYLFLALGIAFFVGLRELLRMCGICIYREETGPKKRTKRRRHRSFR